MIGKDDLDPEIVSGFGQQTGDHAHRIEQLDGIQRLMDVGLDHRTIDPRLPALFDFFVLGVDQKVVGYTLPGLRRQRFDVGVECRLFESLVGDADAAESSQGPGIGDMKRQIFIGETVKPHHHRSANNLLGRHAASPGSTLDDFSLVEILQYMIANGRSVYQARC
jgi:hypothetical protein